jgi:hypothetical protein
MHSCAPIDTQLCHGKQDSGELDLRMAPWYPQLRQDVMDKVTAGGSAEAADAGATKEADAVSRQQQQRSCAEWEEKKPTCL